MQQAVHKIDMIVFLFFFFFRGHGSKQPDAAYAVFKKEKKPKTVQFL